MIEFVKATSLLRTPGSRSRSGSSMSSARPISWATVSGVRTSGRTHPSPTAHGANSPTMREVAMTAEKMFFDCGAATAILCESVVDDYDTYRYFMKTTPPNEFFLADGTSLGVRFQDLAPYSNLQWNGAFSRVTAFDVIDGYVDVWSENTGAKFYVYGSVVGNDDFNDPTTVLPQ